MHAQRHIGVVGTSWLGGCVSMPTTGAQLLRASRAVLRWGSSTVHLRISAMLWLALCCGVLWCAVAWRLVA
jgi:hypothetical protein